MKKLKLEELNRLDVDQYKASSKLPIILIADNIRSGLNVGAFFRSADAFGIEKIILCGLSAQPPHKEINKSAIGATHSVDWEYFEEVKDAVQDLKAKGYTMLGIEQTTESISLDEYSSTLDKLAIVMGNEVDGISESILPLLDQAIEIKQYGTKHSLNVAVCAGIVLHHFASSMR